MLNTMIAASRRWARELIAAGCPIHDPNAITRRTAAERNRFRVEQLDGYAQSIAYVFPTQVLYVIGVRLGTERASGTVLTDWGFQPPWPNHVTCFDYEAEDVIPQADHGSYRHLFDSRLMGVLNERRLLRRGEPVEGLLCGLSYQPVPESCGRSVSAKLTFLDDIGNRAELVAKMAVVRLRVRTNLQPRAPGNSLADAGGPTEPASG